MLPQAQSHLLPSTRFPNPFAVSLSKPTNRSSSSFFFNHPKPPLRLKCSSVSEPHKPFPAEVSRTVLELSSVGTLSTLTQDAWPLGSGVRFAVDHSNGAPILCFSPNLFVHNWRRCSLHVQLNQSGVRTPQCTIQGNLHKPSDTTTLKRLSSAWKKRFDDQVEESNIYYIHVERVLQLEDFAEAGVWVNSSAYASADPDPLRGCAEKIVDEINNHNREDVYRFCNIYADLDFQVLDAKMVWVDRLGFDVHLRSVHKDVYEVRIPFPREVTDEKGAKSSFNGMSQLAWEVEKNFHVPEFEKVKHLKKIMSSAV